MSMNGLNQLVVFTLDDQRYALPLSAVERTIRMVETTPLPKAPDIVSGLINIHGQILPVINIRKLFLLEDRSITPDDQLIIAHSSDLHVALQADGVYGVIECNEQYVVSPEKIFPGIEYIKGVVKLEDGLIFIYDLDRFISPEEGKTIVDRLSDFTHTSPPLEVVS